MSPMSFLFGSSDAKLPHSKSASFLAALSANDSLKRVISGKVDLAEEY